MIEIPALHDTHRERLREAHDAGAILRTRSYGSVYHLIAERQGRTTIILTANGANWSALRSAALVEWARLS